MISQMNEGRENATAISFKEDIYIVGGSKRQRNKWVHLDCIEKFSNE